MLVGTNTDCDHPDGVGEHSSFVGAQSDVFRPDADGQKFEVNHGCTKGIKSQEGYFSDLSHTGNHVRLARFVRFFG